MKKNIKIDWDEAELKFVELMKKNKEVNLVEHISLFAQNSEWDVVVYWKNGDKWYVDVTTGVRKKFNKPKIPGRFFLAFTKDGSSFDLFEIIYTKLGENKTKHDKKHNETTHKTQ